MKKSLILLLSIILGITTTTITYLSRAVAYECACWSPKMTILYGYPWRWYMAPSTGGKLLSGYFLAGPFFADFALWSMIWGVTVLALRRALKRSSAL